MPDPIQLACNTIKKFEGCKLKAYLDQRGIPTVGYGCTGMLITEQTVWTQAQADQALGIRVQAIYDALRRHLMVGLNENQWAALISMAYNIGVSALLGSTLIRELNERNFEGAAGEFPKWDKITVAGKTTEVPGLLARRLKEQALFQMT